MKDEEKATSASRVSAARSALDYAYRAVELEDLDERVATLEQVQQKHHSLFVAHAVACRAALCAAFAVGQRPMPSRSRYTDHGTRSTNHETRPQMHQHQSTKAYRASGMLRRILRLEASPALQTQWDVRWMDLEPGPRFPSPVTSHWVIDVLDDKKPKVSARWRRTTDPNDHGTFPPRLRAQHPVLALRLQPDENVIYEDEVDP